MGTKLAIICGILLLQLTALAQDELPVADNHVHVRSQRAANAWQQIGKTNPELANPAAERLTLAQDVLLDLNLGGIERALLVSRV
jgi:hypothetical protein